MAAHYAFDLDRAIGGRVTLLHVLEEAESEASEDQAAHVRLGQLGQASRRPPQSMMSTAQADAATVI